MTAIVGQQKRAATALNNVSPKDEIKVQFESFLLFWYSKSWCMQHHRRTALAG
jgi:hypothetical protein